MKRAIIEFAKATLPTSIKNSIFHFGFNIAREEFERFAYDYAHAPNMCFGLIAAKERGFSPRAILDIGAYEGSWTAMAREIWPEASLTMIEANESKRALLTPIAAQTGADLIIALLGANEGEVIEFFEMESGSSVFEEESAYDRKKVTRTLSKLDSLIPNERPVDLIKIDTQGYELEVLKGGRRCLERAEAVLLEVSLIEINKGAPLITEVFEFMRDHGFAVYDVLEIHRRQLDAATNQVDVLFVRENSELRASKSFT